jgi:serine/threonine protein kinase
MPSTIVGPNFTPDRSEIGGYRVLRTLVPNQSWLAEAQGGRPVALKVLDEDCLWKTQLHPNIKDRLARVRELAHVGVANLYGVERDGSLTYLVWEYVPGQTLDEYAKTVGPRELAAVARDLVLGVEMLHARGIVHGSLKPSNVIANADGRAVITHVSPLLYTEPADDVRALVDILRELPLGSPMEESAHQELSLRRLAARLGAIVDARETGTGEQADGLQGLSIRRRAVLGAGATALLGIAMFLGLKQYAGAKTPKPPIPPQAAPEALRPDTHAQNTAASVAGHRGTATP